MGAWRRGGCVWRGRSLFCLSWVVVSTPKGSVSLDLGFFCFNVTMFYGIFCFFRQSCVGESHCLGVAKRGIRIVLSVMSVKDVQSLFLASG